MKASSPKVIYPPQLLEAWQAKEISPLKASEINAAAKLLADAYSQDPLIQEIIKADSKQKNLENFCGAYLKTLLTKGLCVCSREDSGELLSIFVFLPPDTYITFWDELFSGGLAMLGEIKTKLPACLELQNWANILRKKYGQNSWYAAYVAVSPKAQRRGWLKKAMLPVIKYAEENGYGFYLETQNPINTQIYAKLGLELVETKKLGKFKNVNQYAMKLADGSLNIKEGGSHIQ